jgi:DNA-binding NarL/FixJ family response regulator
MGGSQNLDKSALMRLREIAQEIHGERQAVPLARLIDLAEQTRVADGVTIDFEGSKDLGLPFLVVRVPADTAPDPCLGVLSPREREVALLVADGLSNKQIAARLHIRLATVKDHLHRILRKTGLPNRAAVAARAAWSDRIN